MRAKDKKVAVFQQLNQETDPISLPDLYRKLGKDYVERSVRRWLTKMAEEGLVEVLGRKRGTKYQIVRKDDTRSHFGAESIEVINQMQRPLYERSPIAYSEEWFNAYQPNVTFYPLAP